MAVRVRPFLEDLHDARLARSPKTKHTTKASTSWESPRHRTQELIDTSGVEA